MFKKIKKFFYRLFKRFLKKEFFNEYRKLCYAQKYLEKFPRKDVVYKDELKRIFNEVTK